MERFYPMTEGEIDELKKAEAERDALKARIAEMERLFNCADCKKPAGDCIETSLVVRCHDCDEARYGRLLERLLKYQSYLESAPVITKDGNQWCCLLGKDLREGIAGFGDTPDAALRAFEEAALKAEREASEEDPEAEILKEHAKSVAPFIERHKGKVTL